MVKQGNKKSLFLAYHGLIVTFWIDSGITSFTEKRNVKMIYFTARIGFSSRSVGVSYSLLTDRIRVIY
jgi:hypothetical protein